jgi:hypothetical protein
MLRWTQQLGLLVVLFALAVSARSQTAHYSVSSPRMMVAREGVEPPTPAFSESILTVISTT